MAVLKAFITDLGGILIQTDWHPMLEKISLASVEERETISRKWSIAKWGIGFGFCRGLISPAAFYQRVCDLFSVNQEQLTLGGFVEAYNNIFSETREMVELLPRLRTQFESMVMITNIDKSHFDFLTREAPHLFQPFDFIVASYKVGFAKPRKEIYELALSLLEKQGIKAEESIFVDDLLENLVGAASAGIKNLHWFNKAYPIKSQVRYLKECLAFHGINPDI